MCLQGGSGGILRILGKRLLGDFRMCSAWRCVEWLSGV